MRMGTSRWHRVLCLDGFLSVFLGRLTWCSKRVEKGMGKGMPGEDCAIDCVYFRLEGGRKSRCRE